MKKSDISLLVFLLLILALAFINVPASKVIGQTQSEINNDCTCTSGQRFDEQKCVDSSGNTACILSFSPVCGCDGKTYSNNCFANAAGVKNFTNGECSSSGEGSISCKEDNDCPLGECPNGATYMSFSCLDGKCYQLQFFANPCEFLTSSSRGIGEVKLAKGFSGIWKAKLPKCNLEGRHIATRLENKKCISCEPVQILCIRGTVRVPRSCNQCIHCEKCSDSGSVTFNLCLKDSMLQGSASSFGTVENGIITSQTVISENEVEVIFEDSQGNSETATLKLKNPKKLIVKFLTDSSVEARKINQSKDCTNQNSSLSSSSGGISENCGSKGSCRGENGIELPCPEGTFCSGLPAYGCYPPNCPVPICCSPDTRIRTTGVQKRIADIWEGEIVLSDGGKPVKVVKVSKTEVKNHKILKVLLNDATILEISPGHPTADGRKFKDLKMGDYIDGRMVVETKLIPYKYQYTHDILPDSKTGNYYANGVLIGSTLK